MGRVRNIVSAIEIGSSKICVLVGEGEDENNLQVIGRGEVASAGTVVKGEIVDMDGAFELLTQAIDDADSSSGGAMNSSSAIAVGVTGCGIDSFAGVGSVFIKNEEHKVSYADRDEALQNARIATLPVGRTVLNSAESYFVIDNRLKVRNPNNQNARKLDAHVRVIHGLANRLENFRTAVRNCGYEENVELIFNAFASDLGILSETERHQGVLLIDFGAGSTEYSVDYDNGVIIAGMLQVGFEHVLNDLSLALNIHIDECRKMAKSGLLAQIFAEQRAVVELPGNGTVSGKPRQVPLSTFETVIDARLQETFSIISKRIATEIGPLTLESGLVVTGGGALLPRVLEIAQNEFSLSGRVGQPYLPGGAVTNLANPRYSTVWGLLKLAAQCNRGYLPKGSGNLVDKVFTSVDGFYSGLRQTFGDLIASFKI
ncbi:MAG: cell division protein FtsA [Victivallaceae bacterium]|nr:cell division protein FtsA [Victivallaceae bacterium]